MEDRPEGNAWARAEALAWLATPDGDAALAEAAALPPDRLTRITRLRRRYPAEVAAAAVELLELRARARVKFAHADAMFFTPEGLEQSTGEAIAAYRANAFPPEASILDACCGIGGDALALVRRGPVLAVDRNPAALVCARANARLASEPTSYPLYPLCADVTTLDLARLRSVGFGSAFFDPSRRTDSPTGERRRARRSEDYAPPLSWLETLRATLPALAVKVSPAIDDAVLERYHDARIDFISAQGECKEAVLWFGPLAEACDRRADMEGRGETSTQPGTPGLQNRRVTILRSGQAPVRLAPFACDPPPPSAPRAWLYEPDPAVIRAHLVPQVAALVHAGPIESGIAYLTADAYRDVSPLATAYRILDWMPFHLKNIQARLRALGRHVAAIKKRGVPLVPEDLRKRLTGAEAGSAPAVVVLTRKAGKPIALLCEPACPPCSGEPATA
jgi:SAM-dependent methyltransferase